MTGTIGDLSLLSPITYFHKTNLSQKKVGITAQNLQQVCAEAVTLNGGNLSIDVVGFVTVLLSHLQSQQAKISELETRLIELENK